MSKTKQKNKSEVEVLRGENRRLKSENRNLRKRVKELEKKSHFYEEIVDEVVEDVKFRNTCRNCGKGEVLSYDMGLIRLNKCNLCDYEKKIKKSLNE